MKEDKERQPRRVLCLDYEWAYEPCDWETFSSDTACLDYDLVIWDPKNVLDEYHEQDSYRGLPTLTEHSSATILRDIARRKRDFDDFLKAGRTLIVINRAPESFYFDSGKREFSGTGKNRQTTNLVNEANVLDALPFDISLASGSGKSMVPVGDPCFSEFFKAQSPFLRYEAHFRKVLGKPLLKIDGIERVVASVYSYGPGRVVFIPAPNFPVVESSDEAEAETPAAGPFYHALVELGFCLGSEVEEVELPEWTESFLVAGEQGAIEELEAKSKAVKKATSQLEESADVLKSLQAAKLLVTASGRQLELAVKSAFEYLGGEVFEPEPGRDDWRVSFPEGDAVVEVKGVKGSAAEKHAAQLEKWVANHMEEIGEQAKGILIVNGWKDLPMDERTEPTFPAQMLKYSKAREHCLISGLQLLGMTQKVKTKPQKATARKLLLTSSGVLVGYEDWSESFEKAPDNEEPAPETQKEET